MSEGKIKGLFLNAFILLLLSFTAHFMSINHVEKLEKRVEALERSGTAAVGS